MDSKSQELLHLDGNLSTDEVHLWHLSHEVDAARMAELFNLLNSEERDRAGRFKVPEPRKQFVISRGALRIILAKYLQLGPDEIVLRAGVNNKPEIAQTTDLRFNLSHTGGKTAIAITLRRNVGVDVERIRENLDPLELAERFFSVQETQWLRSQPSVDRYSAFFACWTAKEAYVKACGTGLSMPLAEFGVKPTNGSMQVGFELYGKPEESKRWSIWQPDLGSEFRAAVAAEGENLNLRLGQFSS